MRNRNQDRKTDKDYNKAGQAVQSTAQERTNIISCIHVALKQT